MLPVQIWIVGLLLSATLVSIGTMALVSAASNRDRLFGTGMLSQGIVVAFVAAAYYHQRMELRLAAIALMVVTALWWVWENSSSETPQDLAEQEHDGESAAVENPES